MIVTLAGASGSGKTTLAKALAEHFGWVFKENSAGLIIADGHKEYMKKTWGYDGNWGQARVINFSHHNPDFGGYFQWSIIAARRKLMLDTLASGKNAIYDRGPLDPIVFWMNQIAHNLPQEESQKVIEGSMQGMRCVDLIIRVPLQNPNQYIENNGSRVPNWFFQKKIDILYDLAIHEVGLMQLQNPLFFEKKPIHILRTSTWDWDVRLNECIKKIESI